MSSVTGRERRTCNAFRNEHLLPETDVCDAHFDKSLCWYNVSRGETFFRQCPFKFCLDVDGCAAVAAAHQVQRTCFENGTWGEPIYQGCVDIVANHPNCITGFCRTCPDSWREAVLVVSMILSVLSVFVLVAALVLYNWFESIQCRRLSIHKNLAAAFVFRFAVLALWNAAQSSRWFYDCTLFHSAPLYNIEWICKLILWFYIYFQVASVIWMLIEGVYLYSRFTVFAMRGTEPSYWIYLLVGWGVPLAVVLCWTVVHEHSSRLNNSFCWLPYAQGPHLWILTGTMGGALVLNVIIFIFIGVILVQKLRSENKSEGRKIWRAMKSAIVLVPLLGVSNIPLLWEPDNVNSFYMLVSAVLQHSQGIFIPVVYCFMNGEILNALKRELQASHPPIARCFRWIYNPERKNFDTQRTYVPDSGIVNKRHGIPMEQLDGIPESQSQQSTAGEVSTN